MKHYENFRNKKNRNNHCDNLRCELFRNTRFWVVKMLLIKR